ncbi:hypothetical protein KR009_006093 [Drosophila setifemur]|nr:hypothetical protein KR009_006093 [Drosophila setifemur]
MSVKNEDVLKHVASVVRALVNSAKPPVYLHNICKDYLGIEGEPLPFRRLGYQSAHELLQKTGEFNSSKYGDEIIITAKYNAKTEHIASMVRSQRPSKSRAVAKPVNQFRRPRYNSYSNLSNRSQATSNQNQYQQHQYHNPPQCRNTQHQHHNPPQQQHQHQQQQHQIHNTQIQQQHQIHFSSQQQLYQAAQDQVQRREKELQWEKAREQEKQALALQWEREYHQATMRAAKLDQEKILITIPNGKQSHNQNQNHAHSNGHGRPSVGGGKPPLRAILGNSAPQRQQAPTESPRDDAYKRQMHPRVLHPGQVRSTGISVNHRLKQKPPTDTPSPMPTLMTPPASPENIQTKALPKEDVQRVKGAGQATTPPKPKPKSQVAFRFDPAYDAVSSLNLYCEAHGFEKPAYNVFSSGPNLHCSVRIEGDVYSSYPQEFLDEETAYQRTAEIAIERIQHAESRNQLANCTLSDEEFIDGLYQELLKYPHGILGHKLEDWYGQTFGRHLPGHWYDLIIESKKIRVEHGINPRIILFANDPGSPDMVHFSTPTIMSELQLPWQPNESVSNDWNMYITHCDSTRLVWARLIDQIGNFEELTTHMSRHMAVPHFRQQVIEPSEQELYLVEIREGWNRVRVLFVDAEQRSCRCHFVDFGDVAQFEFEELFQCPPQFLILPAQAICLSMYALDKFEDHPHALPVLLAELDAQTVVARVLTTSKQFQELGATPQGWVDKNKRRACLVATLYDTSTAEDIHLNDLVASRITKSTPAPSLSDEKTIVKTTPVLVSHITDDGDLMVLLRNDDLKFVERSIANTVADLGEQDRVSYSDLLHDRHVFVCDESVEGMKQWYRGRLVAKPQNPDEETFDIYYVDDGRQRKTHISNIYRLEANNRALATYPPQALAVRLHDVPEIAGQLLMRLRGLMPPRSEALLKVVVKDGTKPLVNIFIRGQGPESMYMCVNIGLRLEFEMQGSKRPEISDELLQRQSSFSSVVSSQSSGSDLVAFTPPVTPQKASPRGAATAFSTGLLKDYEAIPAVGAYFEVRVALSINPGHFAVQPYKFYNQLQCLMKELQEHCKGSTAKGVQPSQLAIGEAYAAPDSDGVYHRVNIRKIYDEIIHVRFVDFGDDGVVACDQLKTLPQEMRKLPKMALPAQLYGIQLTDVLWSQENCVRFRKLTLGQKFIGIVRGLHKHKNEPRVLCLELVDTSTPQDIKLHEILIKEKHAQPKTKEV